MRDVTVELIHPPHFNSLGVKLDVPMGLLTIASALRVAIPGVNMHINDLTGLERIDWNIGIADVYGITVYAPSLFEMIHIVEDCRKQNPHAIIVIGGAHPTADPYLPQYGGVDHIVTGYGEHAMIEIVSNHRGNSRLPRVMNGSFSKFYFPAYDLVDLSTYCRTIDGQRSIMTFSSHGCPFKCAFCGLSKFHSLSKIKFIDNDLFHDHLEKIAGMGIKALNIQDDIFTLNKPRLYSLLKTIKDLGFKFRCMGRAGYDIEEVYEKLAESGCAQIAWGIESGSQYILDRMNKRVRVEDNYNVIRWAKKYGIQSRAFFVLGFPGETRDTIEETRHFIMDADPDQYLISNMIPYPGTEVWNHPDKFGIINLDKDFEQFYQLGKDGKGPLLSFDTEWMSRYTFREAEIELREWLIKNKKFRGPLLDYEKKMFGSN